MPFKVMNIHGGTLESNLQSWTWDGDGVLAVKYNFGGWVTFSNTLFAEQQNEQVLISYDPPGDFIRPPSGPSQHTNFDDVPFSERDPGYQEAAINFFAELVLAPYLQTHTYIVEPNAPVVEALSGRLPQTLDDIRELVANNPDLLPSIQRISPPFQSNSLSASARAVIRALLEDESSLESYLGDSAGFVDYVLEGQEAPIGEAEREALIQAAADKPDLITNTFDSVALGRAQQGDGNTFILIGTDPETNLPSNAGLAWYQTYIADFVAQNGFLPGFGHYVTEASLCYRVIAGPDVSSRAMRYLTFGGNVVVDRRDGQSFGYSVSELDDIAAGGAEE